METFYLFLIIFLFVLAVFDLSVGVSNDAVNFMNSAIGSKAASFKVIMVIAAIGIFVGASLSNGMMDIARHGIYQPQHFYFSEIMCILLAVMLTDVVLLDIFNSLGMPTSRLSSISSSDERWLYSSSVNPISLLPVTIPTLHTLAFTPFFQTFYQHEIQDGSGSQTTEQADKIVHVFLVVEGKNQARNVLNNGPEKESDRH
jgi:hypothetical protein